MADRTWREASRLNWITNGEMGTDQCIAGSLQRIADAMDPFLADYKKATQSVSSLKEDLTRERRTLEATLRSLKSCERRLRRAKKRISELEAK